MMVVLDNTAAFRLRDISYVEVTSTLYTGNKRAVNIGLASGFRITVEREEAEAYKLANALLSGSAVGATRFNVPGEAEEAPATLRERVERGARGIVPLDRDGRPISPLTAAIGHEEDEGD